MEEISSAFLPIATKDDAVAREYAQRINSAGAINVRRGPIPAVTGNEGMTFA
jgi:hypothetical protein